MIPTAAESITSKVKRKKSVAEYEIESGKFLYDEERGCLFCACSSYILLFLGKFDLFITEKYILLYNFVWSYN